MGQDRSSHLDGGCVQVYTGNCKGKTTAAMGLAFRAMGSGFRTYIGQFMKGQEYGELRSAEMVKPYITIEQYGRKDLVHVKEPPLEEDVRMAADGLSRARSAMLSGDYDIVVFDEILTARVFHLVSTETILELMKQRPDNVEVVLTGRYAPQEVIDAADLVTEMVEVKHYFSKGVGARRGIEF